MNRCQLSISQSDNASWWLQKKEDKIGVKRKRQGHYPCAPEKRMKVEDLVELFEDSEKTEYNRAGDTSSGESHPCFCASDAAACSL